MRYIRGGVLVCDEICVSEICIFEICVTEIRVNEICNFEILFTEKISLRYAFLRFKTVICMSVIA